MRRPAAALLLLAASACSRSGDGGKPIDSAAAPLHHEYECASCGMIAQEQPSPRGQLVHRDGAREFFCSVGDLLTYLEAPSPHGAVVATYVEAMDPAADPRKLTFDARPWIAADKATYVLGIHRERIMGKPILSYATRADAAAIAIKYGGHLVTWPQLPN